jgi:nucleoside-diphosphate-sugar epimerase
MIVVTGATGQLGRQNVERLLPVCPRTAGREQDPEKACVFADQGV